MESLRALGEIRTVRRSLELYRAQPQYASPQDFATRIREVLAGTGSLAVSLSNKL